MSFQLTRQCLVSHFVGAVHHEPRMTHLKARAAQFVSRPATGATRRPAFIACAGSDLQDITCKAAIAWEAEKPLEVVDITVAPPQVWKPCIHVLSMFPQQLWSGLCMF